jgi:putative nucleotidyltransferase with HDIG domain
VIKLDLRSGPAGEEPDPVPRRSGTDAADPPESEKSLLEGKPRGKALKKKILQTLTGVLPSMPQIVLKAQEILSNPDSSLKALASVIATDQAISVRALKLANSAYYGLAGKVTSIGHASVLLGAKTLGEIIIMAGTSGVLGNTLRGYGLESEEVWRHSLAVAIGSRFIAERAGSEMSNDAFMAGLIHDSGKIMLDQHMYERRDALKEFMKEGQQPIYKAEHHLLGFDHSEIGAEVCESWGIPSSLTEAIKYHHHPSRSPRNQLAYIVQVADTLAIRCGIGTLMEPDTVAFDNKSLTFLKLDEEKVLAIIPDVLKSVEMLAEKMKEEG